MLTRRRSTRALQLCSFLFFCSAAFTDGVNPTSAMVDSLLQKHSASLEQAVSLLKNVIGTTMLGVNIGPFGPKQVGTTVPARELTMVDFSLGMVDAVSAALKLHYPPRQSKLDEVLAHTVKHVAHVGAGIVQLRANRRAALRQASVMVSALNGDLQQLVPEFGKPIAGHVNFALVEALVRAVGWRHATLMRDLLMGFEPIGSIRSTGCLRPVSEPEPPLVSRASNVQSFDDAVGHLTKKAKKAGDASLADHWVVWDKTLVECEKEFCLTPCQGDRSSLFSRILSSGHGASRPLVSGKREACAG